MEIVLSVDNIILHHYNQHNTGYIDSEAETRERTAPCDLLTEEWHEEALMKTLAFDGTTQDRSWTSKASDKQIIEQKDEEACNK